MMTVSRPAAYQRAVAMERTRKLVTSVPAWRAMAR